MNALILSKNRACQLHLLLETIKLNCPTLFNKIYIIYTGTDTEYLKGYSLLQDRHIYDNIVWQQEKDFYGDFVNFLKTNDTELFCGLTDDCVFYRPTDLSFRVLDNIFSNSDVFCFSLRLGLNTTLQDYVSNSFQNPLTWYDIRSISYQQQLVNIIIWSWREICCVHNYGYPISLDGHIYRTKDMYDLTTKYSIGCLRGWEGVLAENCRRDTNKYLMSAETESSVYCIPNNCVQDPPMHAGIKHNYTSDGLNNQYLRNNIISTDSIITTGVNWCHQELEFKYVEYESDE